MTPARALNRALTALILAIGGLIGAGITGTQAPPAAAAMSDVPAAINSGVSAAANAGITQYVAVIDRSTGQLVGSTANCNTVVASESIWKLFEAAYYLRQYGGKLPTTMNNELWQMIVYSDDAIASKYWKADITSTIANAYGLTNTYNDPNRPGRWGAVRITACSMATFLWRASQDPAVSSWLLGAMASTAPNGSDGYNQSFGFNALTGTHGSKQGWGSDSTWTGGPAIHSVGYTDTIFGAVLSTGGSGTYSTMPGYTTKTVAAIANAAKYAPPSVPGHDNPTGALSAFLQNGAVHFDGWAFDGNDVSWSMPVTISINGGAHKVQAVAGLPSPNLAPYGIPGNHRFFTSWTPPNSGTFRACLDLPNVGAGAPQNGISCIDVSIPANAERDNPRGALTSVTVDRGVVKVTGYAFDPSNLYAQVGTWLAWDGQLVGTPVANAAQPSLTPYGVPGNHGISATFTAPSSGTHQLCQYVVNIGWGSNVWTECKQVTIDPVWTDPRGDFTVTDAKGGVTVVGWGFDPSDFGSKLATMWTVDGKVTAFSTASLASDYLYAYGVPGQHGVVARLGASVGKHSVCMFTFNVGPGSNQLTKCMDVTVT